MNAIVAVEALEARDLFESLGGRLRAGRALLHAIEAGELLSVTPLAHPDRRSHEAGLALLDLLDRQLADIIQEVDAASKQDI